MQDTAATADRLLTTTDAARLANVSGETIRSWANSGKLPSQKTASGIRLFRRADIERVVDQRNQERIPA